MAKFYGKIGYSITTEVRPGVYKSRIIERSYYGDVLRDTSRWSASPDSTNDDLNISNQISIVSDQFAYQNSRSIKYVEFMGAKWKVTNLEIRHPRLILTIGGVYNGKQA